MNWRYKIAQWFCPNLCDQCLTIALTARLEKELGERERNEIKKRYFTPKFNPKPHATRKRTKFKKWYPHGKHSG